MTTKYQQDYVHSLVINTVLDSTHYKLRDLENRVLLHTFHIKRIKPAFVSSKSTLKGS